MRGGVHLLTVEAETGVSQLHACLVCDACAAKPFHSGSGPTMQTRTQREAVMRYGLLTGMGVLLVMGMAGTGSSG